LMVEGEGDSKGGEYRESASDACGAAPVSESERGGNPSVTEIDITRKEFW